MLETPGRMQKSVSSKVFHSASPLEKPAAVNVDSIGKMTKMKSASSRDLLYTKKSLQKPMVDQVSFGRQSSLRDSDIGSMRRQQSGRKNSLTETKKLKGKRLMRGLTQFTNEQLDQQGALRSRQLR